MIDPPHSTTFGQEPFVLPWLISSLLLATPIEEKFKISCEATQSESEESIKADGALTITRRPSKGAALTFDYELMNLSYQAKVEIDFAENLQADRWILYFLDTKNSEQFGWTNATIGAKDNKILIKSKTPDRSVELTFSCGIERLSN